MEKLVKTAKNLDTVFKILSVAVKIGTVCVVVGLGILAAGFAFDLPPEFIGMNWEVADLGFLTITVSGDSVPGLKPILGQAAAELALSLACLVIVQRMIKCVRSILRPMTQGAPFESSVSTNLKRLAGYILFLGIGLNCRETISRLLLVKAFDLTRLLASDHITQLTFHYQFNIGFVIVSAAFLLLSYIFRYGEELQQLSDETL